MRRRPSFEEVVELCIDEVQSGRATPEECLARWPERREELAPILETVALVHAAPRTAERAPDPARRAMLMAALRETPQEQPRSWLPRFSAPSLPAGGLAMRFGAAALPAAAVALLAFVLVLSQANSPAAASTLTVFSGDVEVYRDGRWQNAADGASILEGDRVRTSDAGWALITFDDGSSATLDPATEISIERTFYDGPREIVLRQVSGRVWSDAAPDGRSGARYAVETADTTIEAIGTVFETTIESDGTTVVAAQGLVRLFSEGLPVRVARGEMARATAGALTEHRAASLLDAALLVRAPFTATLLSERGEATGARADGLILHQVRGVTTSTASPGGQRFDLQAPRPGTYLLFLERVGEGEGELVLRTGAGERVIPLTASVSNVRLSVEITDDLGLSRLRVLGDGPERIETPPQLRVPPQALARATATGSATRTPTAATTSAEASPPAFVLRAQAEREEFRVRLDEEIAAGDREGLRRLIDEALTADDATIVRMRMGVLTQVLGNERLADLMRDVLTDREAEPEPRDERRGPRQDREPAPPRTPPGLADRLDRVLKESGPPAASKHLERLLRPRGGPDRGGQPAGRGALDHLEDTSGSESREAESTPTRTSEPESTSTGTLTRTATATPTPTPSVLPEVDDLHDLVDDALSSLFR